MTDIYSSYPRDKYVDVYVAYSREEIAALLREAVPHILACTFQGTRALSRIQERINDGVRGATCPKIIDGSVADRIMLVNNRYMQFVNACRAGEDHEDLVEEASWMLYALMND